MDDAELVDDAAVRAAQQRMRRLERDRPQRHRPLLAQLGAELRGAAIRVALVPDIVHSHTEASARRSAAEDREQPRGLTLECVV